MSQKYFTTRVVGGIYCPWVKWSALTEGETIHIVPDPYGVVSGSKHEDPNALAVYAQDRKRIGFLRRDIAKLLGPMLKDASIEVCATLERAGGAMNTYVRCELKGE